MFKDFLENKLMPMMSGIASQRHLKAIRNGIVATIPLVIVGSFFLILLNVPAPTPADWQKNVLEKISPALPTHLLMAFRLTVGMMALYSAFGIGIALGKEYNIDATTSGVAAMLAFLFSTVPATITPDMVEAFKTAGIEPLAGGQYLSIVSLGSGSLFGAIVYSLIAIEIVHFFKKKNITIKMPDSVPTAISNSFASLFSIGFVILFVWVIRHVLGFDLNAFLTFILKPISKFLVGDNIIGVLLIIILVTLFWSAGLHGVSLVGTLVRPFWEQAITNNSEIFAVTNSAALGTSTPELGVLSMFPEQFFQWYIWIGGSGATIGLCILMFFRARSKFLKEMGKLTFIPAIFNINEPVIFGLPIVMNPILIIPFMLAPTLMAIFAAIPHYLGLVNAMVLRAPWTLPGPLGALMSTNWDWRAGVISVICIIISVLVYWPFFSIYDKKLLSEENEAANNETTNAV